MKEEQIHTRDKDLENTENPLGKIVILKRDDGGAHYTGPKAGPKIDEMT